MQIKPKSLEKLTFSNVMVLLKDKLDKPRAYIHISMLVWLTICSTSEKYLVKRQKDRCH